MPVNFSDNTDNNDSELEQNRELFRKSHSRLNCLLQWTTELNESAKHSLSPFQINLNGKIFVIVGG